MRVQGIAGALWLVVPRLRPTDDVRRSRGELRHEHLALEIPLSA
jgi:hypothetical protein